MSERKRYKKKNKINDKKKNLRLAEKFLACNTVSSAQRPSRLEKKKYKIKQKNWTSVQSKIFTSTKKMDRCPT